jgi:hypothetical protein
MSRYLTRSILAAVLGATGWVASSGTASAQYIPPFGGGFPTTFGGGFPGWNPFLGSPYMGSYQRSFINPYTGGLQSYLYSPYGGVSGYTAFNPFTGRVMSYYANVPYFMGAGYGGGYVAPFAPTTYGAASGGYYGASANPLTNQQLRQLRATSYQNAYPSGGYGDGRSAMSPRWTTSSTDKAPGQPSGIDETLLKASEAEIHSARTLNALAIEIRKLEEKGAKAESPLFPAEVLARVAYEGPGARLLTATRSGKPDFPRPLTGAEFADLRTELERHFDAAVEPAAQGRATDAAADRLANAAEKAKADPALRRLSDSDAADVTKFLDGLVELSKQVKDPSLAGVTPKWGSMGATASELVRHMGRHKLLFAPAPVGSEEAYGALYRGLSGYYVALARAKK